MLGNTSIMYGSAARYAVIQPTHKKRAQNCFDHKLFKHKNTIDVNNVFHAQNSSY
jgi:hypothetical protein